MDKNELRQRLEQVAELKDIKPPRTCNYRPAIEYITEVDEDGEEYQVPVEITENPTLGFQLVKLKDQHRVCELGCGDIVTNQVIEKRHGQTPKSHWKTRCKNCDHYVSPDGLGFIKGGHQIQHAYMKYFNGQKPTLDEKKIETPAGPARVTETEDYTETTTNDSVIRRYK
jgi:hypothetical protein